MRFEDSKYFHEFKHVKVEFSFGNIYFFDKFILSEINEGVHFDWEKIEEVIAFAMDHYGPNFKIAYISNRVNSYSLDPHSWSRFQDELDHIVASAIVYYSYINFMNASIEKLFSPSSMKRCETLEEAMEWVQNLREFQRINQN
ncbi:hypothetical protein [Mangrovimonas xylaniphaga]|uniref:hypothetical protein n=1 Tax=Mangrovimonas xylaniphaga TaxID=1645915 RepID=UPI0006B41DDD|nr:hypothetical protein [Mangrovimonas xylaniphaga]